MVVNCSKSPKLDRGCELHSHYKIDYRLTATVGAIAIHIQNPRTIVEKSFLLC